MLVDDDESDFVTNLYLNPGAGLDVLNIQELCVAVNLLHREGELPRHAPSAMCQLVELLDSLQVEVIVVLELRVEVVMKLVGIGVIPNDRRTMRCSDVLCSEVQYGT